jgi:hypothetical protein
MDYKLYGFIAGVVRIYEQLSPTGKKQLRRMLRDGLQPDNHCLLLQHGILCQSSARRSQNNRIG